MAMGRIKRNRAKVKAAAQRQEGRGYRNGPRVQTYIRRTESGYTATACLLQPGRTIVTGNNLCTLDHRGRTPQSALAKAAKASARLFASRDQRVHDTSHGRLNTRSREERNWLKKHGVKF